MGNVSASSSSRSATACAGGFVGYYKAFNATVTNSYATGNATANNGMYVDAYAGGFVGGMDYDATIINCYATGDVNVVSTSTGDAAGGFVGMMTSTASISNCYATGNVNVPAGAYAGGVVGFIERGNITNSYRYSEQNIIIDGTTATSNAEGFPCDAESLSSKSFFSETLGWSEEIWDFSDLDFSNDKHPFTK